MIRLDTKVSILPNSGIYTLAEPANVPCGRYGYYSQRFPAISFSVVILYVLVV